MIRTGVREKMVSFAVIFMVLFLVIESYMGDIQTVAVETEMLETDGDLDLSRFRVGPKISNVLPQEIDLNKGGEEDEDGGRSYYINEILPEGSLDEMVEDSNIDMEELIREAETKINNSINTNRNNKHDMVNKDDTIVKTKLVVRPPNGGGRHPGYSYLLGNNINYTQNQEAIRFPKFTLPQDVKKPSKDSIELGLIVMNLKKSKDLDPKFAWKLKRTLNSLLIHSSIEPILHFVLVTDLKSLESVGKFFCHLVSKQLAERVIVSSDWRWRRSRTPPTIKISFVNIENIRQINPDFIDSMKKSSMKKETVDKDKYASDLFYISPLYHRAFTSLDRIIFLDSTDLEFFSDVLELESQFEGWAEEAVLAVAVDMSPHYKKFLGKYIEVNPATELGQPGPRQGFNTGVVLFRLERMRSSKLYNEFVTGDRVRQLHNLYMFDYSLGDQDWFSELGFSHPNLFHLLPCQFNRQTSIQYLQPPWEMEFDSYHQCVPKKDVKIMHRNGCGPTPEHCGNPVREDSKYWAGRKNHMYYLHMDIEALWDILSDPIHFRIVTFKNVDSK